jgi:hypothetical protein
MKDNLGILNAIFVQNIENILARKNGSSIIKEYLSLIKNNRPLLKEYLVFEAILDQKNCNNLKDCIIESISYLDNVDKKELKSLNKKLNNFITENKINEMSEIKENVLFEAIDNLIFTSKTLSTINERFDKIDTIIEYIKDNNIKTNAEEKNKIDENGDAFYKFTINKFNKKYKDILSDEEKTIFKDIISTKNSSDKSKMFEQHKNNCLELTNSVLSESIDLITKEKLLSVKEKLLEQKYSENTFIDDIISFVNLKQALSE